MGSSLAMMQTFKFMKCNIFMAAMHSVYQTLVRFCSFTRMFNTIVVLCSNLYYFDVQCMDSLESSVILCAAWRLLHNPFFYLILQVLVCQCWRSWIAPRRLFSYFGGRDFSWHSRQLLSLLMFRGLWTFFIFITLLSALNRNVSITVTSL